MTALTQAAQGAGASYNVVGEKRVDFKYRADGQFAKIARFAGTTGTTSNDVVESTYGYDQLGRLTSLAHVDVAGTTTQRAAYTWAYDEFNRLESATERFNNDAATDRATTHTYDHNGQLASTVVDLPSPASDITTNYAYDANGNRTSGQTADADNYNRVLSDATYSYRYDDEGNQTARTVKDTGVREALTWDHRNRLAAIASLVPREIAHWRFDGNAENATGNAAFDGTLVGDTHYDDADPVGGEVGNEYLVLDGNGDYVSLGNDDEFKIRTRPYFTVSAWFNPADGADRFMTIVEQGNPVNDYGHGYRLAYQGGYNPPQVEFMLNNGSQLELVLTKSFTGGLAGEWHHVAVTTENASGGDIHLYVDGELVNSNLDNNRNGDLQGGVLQVASQGGGTPGYFDRYIDDVRIWHEALSPTDVAAVYASSDALYKATTIVEYGYDAFDRRVVKEIDANGNGAMTDAGDKASQYVYDGQDIVLAFDKTAALANRYLHGPAVDQILADEQYTGGASPANGAGTTYWPLADNQGSVRQLVTGAGEEAKRINYDSFGQMSVVSGAAVDHIFAYTGREHDAESHLQYNRARYYDAALGRWISEDPIGFAAGDANLSRYVGNGPTNATDPSGEFLHILGGAVIGAAIGAATKIGGSLISGNGMPSWGDVGIAALEGAVGGAVSAAFPGAGGVAAGIAKRVVGAAIQGAKVGAAAGAVAGAAASVTRQYCEKGKVDVRQVIKDAGEGALVGAIAGAIVGAAGQAWKELKNAGKGQGPKPADQGKPAEQAKPADQPKPAAQAKPADQPKPAAQPKAANQPKPADQPKPMGDGLPDTSGEADVPLPPIPKPRFGGRARPPFRPASRDPRSTALSPTTPDGKYIYVQDPDGVVHVLPVDAPGGHASVLGGSNKAVAAGELMITDGVVRDLDNVSGSFRFSGDTLDDAAAGIRQQGVPVAPNAPRVYDPQGY